MAQNYIYTNFVNAVADGLRALAVPAAALADFEKKIIFGEDTSQLGDALPAMWIHLDSPALQEEWEGGQNRKKGTVNMLISIACTHDDVEATGEGTADAAYYPYGKGGTGAHKGIMAYTEMVMNAIDGLGFSVANAARMEMTVKDIGQPGDERWVSEIQLKGIFHFAAGGR